MNPVFNLGEPKRTVARGCVMSNKEWDMFIGDLIDHAGFHIELSNNEKTVFSWKSGSGLYAEINRKQIDNYSGYEIFKIFIENQNENDKPALLAKEVIEGHDKTGCLTLKSRIISNKKHLI